jgi:hypothetical protein
MKFHTSTRPKSYSDSCCDLNVGGMGNMGKVWGRIDGQVANFSHDVQ